MIFLVSCEKKDTEVLASVKKDSIITPKEDLSEKPITTLCLMGVNDKDSLFISYEDNLGTITGELKYKNPDKGSSFGEISGLMAGDTLKLSYFIENESGTSDKEVWFLKKDNTLKEAVGQYDASGLNYQNYKNITFTGAVLSPTDCKMVEKELAKTGKSVKKEATPPPAIIPVSTSKKTTKEKEIEKKKEPIATKKEADKKKENNASKKENAITKKVAASNKKNEPVKKGETITKKKKGTKENK